MPFMALFAIFIDEMNYSIQILSGYVEDSKAKYIIAIFLAVIGYSLMFGDFINKKIQTRDKKILLFLFLLIDVVYVLLFILAL